MSVTPRRFTLDEYHRLLDGNVLRRGSRTELLDGLLLDRDERTERQAQASTLLHRRLGQLLPPGVQLRADEPLTVSQDTELTPALSVVSAEVAARAVRHPSTATLVIEVADTDLERIRKGHVRAWARAGVQELWLVNLVDRRIDVLWKPDAEAFQDAMVLATPTTLTSRSLPNVTLAVGALFGL
jgi:Uma2 family endonuclease